MNQKETCYKKRIHQYSHAVIQAFHDEDEYGDKRKVYFCMECGAYHTSREKVNGDQPLLER